MKTFNNIFKATSLLAVMSLAMTSCNDWLTVHPQTQIVEENFWEDKNDLEGVRYGVYKNMASQVDKMIIWGDLRSDIYKLNTMLSSQQGSRDDYRNIIQANIDTTWSYYDWSGMYTTIGYCNKVLQHGEEVLEKDKQFTSAEWRQMRAEMVTMRALSYFYLVRAFKSIPYTTKVVNSDSDVEYFPQLPVLDVMDSLITDVESIAGQARNRFIKKEETKGMITNTAIYALLSDMYLWRASILQGRGETDKAIADYQACIRNSELSIDKLIEQFEEEKRSGFMSMEGFMSWSNAPLFNGRAVEFMYKNDIDEANRGHVKINAYEEIFGKKNCYESIFELQYNKNDGRANEYVNGMWGTGDATTLVSTFSGGVTNDIRYWFSGWQEIDGKNNSADFYVTKWNKVEPIFKSNIGTNTAVIAMKPDVESYNNWIIYRLSDVLLQNAEARACLAALNIDKAENNDMCKRLMRMVNRRWWLDIVNGGEVESDLNISKDYDLDHSQTDMLKVVMDTRKIEFVGEGKRWYDLVRFAERLSASDEDEVGMREMYNTYMSVLMGYETARNRCENLWGLYSPIYYMECKAYRAAGAVINQNPVWNKSKYDRK